MKLFKTFSLLVVLLVSSATYAQKNHSAQADANYEEGKYFGSIELYKKAYAKEKSKAKKVEILYKIGNCYKNIHDDKQAEVWFNKAITAHYSDPIVFLNLADVLKKQERYDEALIQYQNYLKEKPGDALGETGAESCKLAQEWKDNPTKYDINNEVLLNSKQYDYSPVFADKKNSTLIFVSTRPGATGDTPDNITGESFPDMYFSKRDKKGKWSAPTRLIGANSEHGEGPATLDKRKSLLYFTRCEYNKKEDKSCHIFKSKKMGNKWAEAEVVDFKTDSAVVGHPSMSADDKYLFFVAKDMAGGKGGRDIWFVKYDKKGRSWSAPQNCEGINTERDEMFPYIAADGNLYFSSNGHLGMGGLDIFKAKSTGTDTWGEVTNMKSPINSSGDDFGIIYDGKKDKGYFTSNRRGGKGGDDIYSFFAPPTIYIVQGNLYDIDTKAPLEGVTIKLTDNEGKSVEVKTDQTGFYMFDVVEGTTDRYIQANSTYKIEAHKRKFLSAHAEETTVGVEESTTFVHNFSLQNFSDNTVELKFPEVLYDLGKWDLRPESKDSLNFLYQLLIDNPTLVIELSAHTDSRGADKPNQELSQKRAQSCVVYLIEKGIADDRLVAKGYGESRLIFADADIAKFNTEEEQEHAHQKNRRTVFSVLKDDYVPHATAPVEETPKEEAPTEETEGE